MTNCYDFQNFFKQLQGINMNTDGLNDLQCEITFNIAVYEQILKQGTKGGYMVERIETSKKNLHVSRTALQIVKLLLENNEEEKNMNGSSASQH